MKMKLLNTILLGTLALLGTAFAADRLELTDGSIIYGKLLTVEGGKFKIETKSIGTIEIAQDKVKTFSTDEPVSVGLASGPLLGQVMANGNGIEVVTPSAQVAAPTGKVVAMWRRGTDSPEERKRKAAAAAKVFHWAYEASAAIAGRTGVAEKFGADLAFKATLANDTDKLVLTYQADRETDNGAETANREFGGADFSTFNKDDNGWYARTSLEQDRIKLLDLRWSSAAGFAHKLIKTKKEDLEIRAGVDYVSEQYSNDTSFYSPGLDIALLQTHQFKTAKMTNSIVYTPAFKNFSNYRVHHESAFEIPLGASMWKLKLGLSNDYTSIPPDDVPRLDTTYFTSLLLNWK